MTSTEGVDYSFARPSPAALKAAGKKFAARYAGPGSDGKHLHADELAALRANGVDVVANAEGAARGYNSAATGRAWATAADTDFRALGMPASRPIYFSVDWAAGPDDWAGVDAALHASAAVIGADRVGVYGSYDTIAHCVAAGTARWFWQTYAWSGGRQHPRAHLYQYRNGVTIGGGDCDLTRALADDYGQWGYQGDDMTFEADQVPVKYPTQDPNNPTWSGPNALGAARDLAAETRDRVKALQAAGDLNQKAVLSAIRDGLTAVQSALTAQAQAEQARDATNLTALLNALGGLDGGNVTVDELTTALQRVYGAAFTQAAGSRRDER